MEFPPNRRMHIVRIFGTNRKGERLTDVWLDLIRIDRITIKTQDTVHHLNFTNQFQEVNINLKWNDRGGVDGESETRETEILKVCSSDESNFEDPDEWVPVPVIKRIKLLDGNVDNNRRFLTKISPKNSKREVENRRFFHYDTNIDTDAENSGQLVYFVEAEAYTKIGDKDEANYCETEVITKFTGLATHHWLESNGDDLFTTFKIKNEYLLDLSEPAKLEEQGVRGFDPPFRPDPYQNIVNCNFGGLAVEFLDGAS